jgi:hypothetical protein
MKSKDLKKLEPVGKDLLSYIKILKTKQALLDLCSKALPAIVALGIILAVSGLIVLATVFLSYISEHLI